MQHPLAKSWLEIWIAALLVLLKIWQSTKVRSSKSSKVYKIFWKLGLEDRKVVFLFLLGVCNGIPPKTLLKLVAQLVDGHHSLWQLRLVLGIAQWWVQRGDQFFSAISLSAHCCWTWYLCCQGITTPTILILHVRYLYLFSPFVTESLSACCFLSL